jgi:hypothetical protein
MQRNQTNQSEHPNNHQANPSKKLHGGTYIPPNRSRHPIKPQIQSTASSTLPSQNSSPVSSSTTSAGVFKPYQAPYYANSPNGPYPYTATSFTATSSQQTVQGSAPAFAPSFTSSPPSTYTGTMGSVNPQYAGQAQPQQHHAQAQQYQAQPIQPVHSGGTYNNVSYLHPSMTLSIVEYANEYALGRDLFDRHKQWQRKLWRRIRRMEKDEALLLILVVTR